MIRIVDARDDWRRHAKKVRDIAEQTDEKALATVQKIIKLVRDEGDQGLLQLVRKLDWPEASIEGLVVQQDEIDAAYAAVDADLLKALRGAAKNIRAYHEQQKREGYMIGEHGMRTGQILRPLKRVGVYVPGGRAAYPSTVLMNVIPAKVAGVQEIIMVTPANEYGAIEPLTLVAANEAGATAIYRIGGAQAIAALAYGTQTIPQVDKIVGPGNIYVALAKREVFGTVGIDMLAGPSEVLIMADETADARFVAADMLSQAEHDPLAAAYLVTNCEELAEDVQKQLEVQLANLQRRHIASASLDNRSRIFITNNLNECLAMANAIAPEHLELMVDKPGMLLDRIENAGSVFLGAYSPEPLGDYYAGTNHVLPTSGTARFSSPLGVDDFLKKMGVIFYNKEGLHQQARAIWTLAQAEGLDAHAKAVSIRFKG